MQRQRDGLAELQLATIGEEGFLIEPGDVLQQACRARHAPALGALAAAEQQRAGIGVGLAASGGVQAMGRNPDAAPLIQTNMILGMAFAEAVAIYALAVALIIIFAA